ncbi:MAG: glucose-1-phosphate adenylyltransferase [Acidobacteria bacterium]|nr:glucose-1-phosphate adenylyltransferase [Acidobacteriota bacterium]
MTSDATRLHPDILREVVTLVLAGGRGERLYPLTRDRSKPAVPFGGHYRIIDFTLSNCINSGLRRVYLLPQYKSLSLMRHVREGWNILANELGEYITTIPPQLRVGTKWYEGTADAVFQNVYTLDEERPERVLILSGDHIYRMDYRAMIVEHIERGAQVSLAVMPVPARDAHRFGIVDAREDGFVRGFREKPKDLDPSGPEVVANMGVYLFDTDVLVHAVTKDSREETSTHDFGYDILPKLVEGGARVLAHRFTSTEEGREPYWRDIGTLDAYYDANMDLVSVSPLFNLYEREWPIRTQPLHAAPAKFVFAGGEKGRIGVAYDSLVSPGVIVSGGQVERSILGPWCRVNSWARVEDSILMHGVDVGRHAVVRRAIVDKGVHIPAEYRIGVDPEEDRARFTVTEQGIVVIPRGERLD